MTAQAKRDIRRKLKILERAEKIGNERKTCRYYWHEFQARFHWHLLGLGIDHVCIKPRRPYLNGKVERSHRTDEEEFYQLIEYTDDVDLNEKLEEWEKFYNLHRSHASHGGNTPYEVLRAKLEGNFQC